MWLLALGRAILNLTVVPRLDAAAIPASTPLVSIVIPARNESAVIERTVRAFLAQDYVPLEVVVVNDRSTDDTGAILGRFDDARLTVITGDEPPDGWLGKPWALEQGSRAARGELILFADADIVYAPEAIRAAVAEMLRSNAALLALFPHFEMHGFAEHVGMGMLPFALAAFPVWLSNRWQRARFGMGGGAGNFVRRDALERIGFFANMPDAVIDDVTLAQNIRRGGGATYLVHAEHLIHVRMYTGGREIVEGFTKNIFAAFRRSYTLAFLFLIFLVVAHLFPYVYALTGDTYAIATVVIISVIRAILFRATGHSLLNAIFLHPFMIAFWAYIFLRSIWITGVLGQVRWRGRVYDATRTRFGSQR